MNAKIEQAVAVKTSTMGELFGAAASNAANVPLEVRVTESPLVPAVEDYYTFQEDHVRRLLLWHSGVGGRNLLISGPTGCGKSSVIEQFSARMGLELYRVACHGKMEFGELTGNTVIQPDGSTSFIHGPLPRAMKTGAVLLMDEVNFLPPGMLGALNTVLDGGTLLIPETGELVVPHPDFRVVATGNSVERGDDSAHYAGTQRMNLAFKLRFSMLKADYLSSTEEAAMIHRAQPTLPAKAIEVMCSVASDVRGAFKLGSIASVISTRIMVKWAHVMATRVTRLVEAPEAEMKFALQFVLTDGLDDVDGPAISAALEKKAAGLKLAPVPQAKPKPAVSGTQSKIGRVNIAINPGTHQYFAARFSGVRGVMSQVYRGEIHEAQSGLPEAEELQATEAHDQYLNAVNQHNHTITVGQDVPHEMANAVIAGALGALSNAICNKPATVIPCGSPEAVKIAEGLAQQIGINYSFVV